MMPLSIPEVDLARDDAAERLIAAYADVGFAYLVGHGVDIALREAVFEASKQFHASPRALKESIALNSIHRGFIAIDTSTTRHSTLANVTKPNQSESFMMMRDDAAHSEQVRAGNYLAGPNQWPDWLPGFREALEAYHEAMIGLGMRLISLVERGLGEPTGSLARHFDPPTTWLRLLHYPPRPADAPDDLYGSAPHADFGFLTLLAQDDVGGLEVRSPDGTRWIDVPPRDDAFVMNVGDMLHQWSNGRLRSTPHRVYNRSNRERYSVPFFFDPHVSTVIEPLASCVTDGVEPRFAPVHFGEFLRGRLEGSYVQHQKG
ncbi:MAG TPA: 2OG-Fe(II) oxygenase [Acidimicrobiaceae bacterium]|nr:2OG-Fe(II) oxygenase [Acidimicrobiaceae bacterium]